MHVISRKALQDFASRHPDASEPLSVWFRIMTKSGFSSLPALRQTLPSADPVGELVVFNIGGNKYRLICSIHFNRQKVYIRDVLTHSEYDRGKWKR